MSNEVNMKLLSTIREMKAFAHNVGFNEILSIRERHFLTFFSRDNNLWFYVLGDFSFGLSCKGFIIVETIQEPVILAQSWPKLQ